MKNAIEELKKYYNFNYLPNGYIKSEETIIKDDILYYKNVSQGLFYLVHYNANRKIKLLNNFDTLGSMIDLSRNQVFKVSYFKDVIRKKAMLGVNKIMLYMEDVYEVKEYEYFGYLRGRYSVDELKELDKYAKIFDIELIPSIQTLGHLGNFLRWPNVSELKDMPHVIMTETEECYKFIESMIKTIKEAFSTNTIHIGMDETFGLGRGNYLKKFGYVEQYDLFINHLIKVNNICLDNGFNNVLMWSDMFFRTCDKYDGYYNPDIELNERFFKDIPLNVELVYWDYYNSNQELVEKMIDVHKKLNRKVVFASGTWIWTKLFYDKRKTDSTALKHINACVKKNIREMYFTEWNDDGSIAEYESVYLGTYEMNYYALTGNENFSSKAYSFITKNNYKNSTLLSKINECPIEALPLLYDDYMLGIWTNNELILDKEILDKTIVFLNNYIKEFPKKKDKVLNHGYLIANVLYYKTLIRNEIIKGYEKKNINLYDYVEKLKKLLVKLKTSFTNLWLEKNKANGLEVIEGRIAILITRLETTERRINDFNQGKIKKLEELEDKITKHQYLRLNHMNIAYSSIYIHQ